MGARNDFNRKIFCCPPFHKVNKGPAPREIQQFPGQFQSWQLSKELCERHHLSLCTYEEICPQYDFELPRGTLRLEGGDVWSPVGNSVNDWVQIGDVHYHW